MATTFKIEVLADKVEAQVKNLQRKSQDTTKVFQTIGRVLVNRIRLGFRASRSPKGVPWAPLTSRIGQPLMDKRRLLRSILPKAGNGFVEVGTNLKVPGGGASLGAVHQFGAEIKPKKAKFLAFRIGGRLVLAKQVTIPARPFMPLNPAGQIDLPPAWSQGILRELGNYFGFGKVLA
jgi:phage gpG-like protein